MKERKRERGDKKERVRASVRATGIANESFFLRERCCCASEKVREREKERREQEKMVSSQKKVRGDVRVRLREEGEGTESCEKVGERYSERETDRRREVKHSFLPFFTFSVAVCVQRFT